MKSARHLGRASGRNDSIKAGELIPIKRAWHDKGEAWGNVEKGSALFFVLLAVKAKQN